MNSKQERVAACLVISVWVLYFAIGRYSQHVHQTHWLPSPTERLMMVTLITQATLVALLSIYLTLRQAKRCGFSVQTFTTIGVAIGYCIWSLPIALGYLSLALSK